MKGNIAIFFALLICGVINFASLVLFTRMLTPADYGEYAVIMAVTTLSIAFGFSWIDATFSRYIVNNRLSSKTKYLSNTLTMYLIAILIFATLITIYFLANKSDFLTYSLMLMLFFLVVSEVLFNIISIYTRLGRGLSVHFALSQIARAIIMILLSWWFLNLGYGYESLFIASIISFALPGLVNTFFVDIRKNVFVKLVNKKTMLEIFNFGIPLMVVMAVQSAINATDRLLLAGLIDATTAGQYAVSQDLVVKLLIFLLAIVHKVTLPLSVSIFENESLSQTNIQFKSNITFLLLLAVPAVFAMSIYAGSITNVILGPEFVEMSTELMPYQVVIALLNCLTMFYVIVPFYLYKLMKKLILPGVVALISNVVIGYFAIQIWGVYGALIGSFAAYFLYFAISLFIGRKIAVLPWPVKEIAKIIFMSVVMVAILLPFKGSTGALSLTGLVVIGGVTYFIGAFLLDIGGIKQIIIHGFRAKFNGVKNG